LRPKDFTSVSAATSDVNQNLVAFADDSGAYLVSLEGDRLVNQRRINEEYRQTVAGDPPRKLSDACIESYGLKPKKFLNPLLERYGNLIYSFKMYYPNGGPYAFVDVATGQVDVYLAVQQPFVDVFSALEIARHAGAVISDFEGKPFKLTTDDCRTTYDVIASRNQQIHDLVLEQLSAAAGPG